MAAMAIALKRKIVAVAGGSYGLLLGSRVAAAEN
jgi:hypothetical protein